LPDLQQELRALRSMLDWPETPRLAPRLEPRRRSLRPLALAVAALVLAVAIAFAVPPARSSILRFLHLGGVTVERVDVLPAAQARPLGASLGTPVTADEAEAILGRPFSLPPTTGTPTLYANGDVVSTLLAMPEPVLLSELASDGPFLLKKVAASATNIESAAVGPGVPALWLSGGQHVFIFPGAPPRLAGNVLVWVHGGFTYRLEKRQLTKDDAVALARRIDGT
jgi:hypothetical protein